MTLESYRVERELGSGASGVVYAARSPSGARVAVKVFSQGVGPRFEREIEVLAALDHPNVVRLIEAGLGPPPYVVMDHVEGTTLASLLRRGPLPPERAARLVGDAARGAAQAHVRGIVHRDLKPENVLVRADDGRAVVADFGIAKDLDGASLTSSGALLGTLSYMSPEQLASAKHLGPATDVWSLGVILFQCLTGFHPFERGRSSAAEVIAAIERGDVPRPRDASASVPPHLEALCVACLALDPSARPSAGELARALDSGPPAGAAPAAWRSVLVAAFAAVGLVVALVGFRPGPPAAPPPNSAATGAPTATPPSGVASAWPELQPSWRPVWSLGEGAAPSLEPGALWADARTADPLAGVRDDGERAALEAAFLGPVRRKGGGRVAVRYDLERAVRGVAVNPAELCLCSSPGEAFRGPERDAGYRVVAWNAVRLRFGAARFAGAHMRVRLAAREAPTRPVRIVTLWCGEGEAAAGLRVAQEEGSALVRRGATSFSRARCVAFADGRRVVELHFAPGDVEGRRVIVDGAPLAALAGDAASPAPPGAPTLELEGGDFSLEEAEVDGVPLRPDVPATALVPRALPTSARIDASFSGRDPGFSGGPFVALGSISGDRVSLELDGTRLVLRHGDRSLAAVGLSREAERGWLVLERRGDELRGALRGEHGEDRLEAVEPLPLACTEVRALYGSTASRTRFGQVLVHAGPDEPARRRLDQAVAEGRLADAASDLAGDRSALAAWRRGAFALARLVEPSLADAELTGERLRRKPGEQGPPWADAWAPRRRAAAIALDSLTDAAERLRETNPRRDALARAVIAALLRGGGETCEEEARRLAERLVGAEGAERARARLEAVAPPGASSFMDLLCHGFLRGEDEEIYRAATTVALALAPDDPSASFHRAITLRMRAESTVSTRGRDARDTQLLLEARARLERARERGVEPESVDLELACVLEVLDQLEDALARWDGAARGSLYWYVHFRRALLLYRLRRDADAVEAALVALACSRDRSALLKLACKELGNREPDPKNRGHVAVLHLVLAECPCDASPGSPRQHRAAHRARAEALAAGDHAAADDRDRDLALYALVRLARPSVCVPERGDRPTLAFARARAADSPELARAALGDAASRDRLVWALVRLDDKLAPLDPRAPRAPGDGAATGPR